MKASRSGQLLNFKPDKPDQNYATALLTVVLAATVYCLSYSTAVFAQTTDLATNEQSPEEDKQDRLEAKLNDRLLGGWALVSTVEKKISAKSISAATQRCLKQLTLKPLAFDPSAIKRIPDIDALYGDVIYYRTEKGLQRMDLKLGQIILLDDISIKRGANKQPYWSVRNDKVIFRLRFSNALPKAPNANFMLENLGFYVRCGSKNKDKFVQ